MLRRAQVVGLGCIGGSIGLSLREAGWWVTGTDTDEDRSAGAKEIGAIDTIGRDLNVDITFVATPVAAIAGEVDRALADTDGLVSDVAGIKAAIVDHTDNPRFVGGHPMAGSEREGLDGASPDLFRSRVWVLTPTRHTADRTFTEVRSIVSRLGAEVISLDPKRHDEMVAMVSHVPHLTAATLMAVAADRATDQRALLRLAAGGFRDMTRISAGHPGIWPDIIDENRVAILSVLDELIDSLGEARSAIADRSREPIVERLVRARQARMNLPERFGRPTSISEILIPIADRPGMFAQVTNLATELDINILDIEVRHSAEGLMGVLYLIVEADRAAELADALTKQDFVPSVRTLQ